MKKKQDKKVESDTISQIVDMSKLEHVGIKERIKNFFSYILGAIILIIFWEIIYSIIDSHPILYARYFYEKFTNNSSEYFSFATSNIDDGFFREDEKHESDYIPNKYFTDTPYNTVLSFDVSNFTDEGYILISGYLYNSFEKAKVYVNNKEHLDNRYDNYYSVFSKTYVASKINAFMYKEDLLLNQQNKITFIIGDKIYEYYFYVISE